MNKNVLLIAAVISLTGFIASASADEPSCASDEKEAGFLGGGEEGKPVAKVCVKVTQDSMPNADDGAAGVDQDHGDQENS